MVGLDALPLPAREKVVLFVPFEDAMKALPFVSEGTLAALKELRLPLGKLKNLSTVEAAARQANLLRRAWDLGTLSLRSERRVLASHVRDLSGLARCTSLHTLDLTGCRVVTNCWQLADCPALHTLDLSGPVTDLSELAGCAKLHTLRISRCNSFSDLSALVGCATLHTLVLSGCQALTDVSALAGCATLRTLTCHGCGGLADVSGLAGCAALRTLNCHGCRELVDVSALAGCAALHTLDLSDNPYVADVSPLPRVARRFTRSFSTARGCWMCRPWRAARSCTRSTSRSVID